MSALCILPWFKDKIIIQVAYKSHGADHGEGAWARILLYRPYYGVMNDVADVMVESAAQ